jgi:[ribosomal protein S18]-alanine N-acetyltransferase
MNPKIINSISGRDSFYSDEKIVDFLFIHLGKYGDKKDDIQKCINYVHDKGGFTLLEIQQEEIVGAVIINETGMEGYIPENILVYIAVHENQRGKGLGKELMKNAIKLSKGNIALHVEKDNPAVFLYEKLGFENKYLEMRLNR